ncbi:hypothetical protein [Streptomyces sp. NPDC058739]|uniref:hypothetical protein n=1 Tax=Streptomyces sp. NPDC058739 TaxID=3346618 RepID=UPI0036B20178
MVTVLFVHGTGVREFSDGAALKRVRAEIAARHPEVRVEACDWGAALGTYLREGGASIPGFVEQGGRGPAAPAGEDEEIARWALLYADPFAELELLALTAPAAGAPFVPGGLAPGDRLLLMLEGLADRQDVVSAWTDAALGLSLAEAAAAVASAGALRRAAARAAEVVALPRLAARALVAYALAREDAPGCPAVAVRDALVDRLTQELGGDVRALPEAVAAATRLGARLFENALGSRLAVARRTAWSGRSVGFFGDIARYLVRGEGVRALVAQSVREQSGPVVLLGHSLGGVVCFDLLASGVLPGRAPDGRPGGVAALVTVGSQVPLLYELDALPSRPYGSGLPDGFPHWLNVYDRRDLLSYTAAEVFRGGVTDLEVDNRQPVSAAHGAYWANDLFYAALTGVLDRVGPP